MKRTVPLMIAAVVGFVMIAAHFIPYADTWAQNAMIWFDILSAVAFILGGGNLLAMHLRKISDRKAGWGFSAVTLVAFLVTLGVGLGKVGVHPAEQFPEFPWSGEYIQNGGAFHWIYANVISPLEATMFALLAFFVASAAFRSFRAKNTEAVLLLGTAFVILLGRTYAGTVLTAWVPDEFAGLRIENISNTIMSVFNLAGTRAITIGIALGIVSTSLKVLLGVDRSYLGSD